MNKESYLYKNRKILIAGFLFFIVFYILLSAIKSAKAEEVVATFTIDYTESVNISIHSLLEENGTTKDLPGVGYRMGVHYSSGDYLIFNKNNEGIYNYDKMSAYEGENLEVNKKGHLILNNIPIRDNSRSRNDATPEYDANSDKIGSYFIYESLTPNDQIAPYGNIIYFQITALTENNTIIDKYKYNSLKSEIKKLNITIKYLNPNIKVSNDGNSINIEIIHQKSEIQGESQIPNLKCVYSLSTYGDILSTIGIGMKIEKVMWPPTDQDWEINLLVGNYLETPYGVYIGPGNKYELFDSIIEYYEKNQNKNYYQFLQSEYPDEYNEIEKEYNYNREHYYDYNEEFEENKILYEKEFYKYYDSDEFKEYLKQRYNYKNFEEFFASRDFKDDYEKFIWNYHPEFDRSEYYENTNYNGYMRKHYPKMFAAYNNKKVDYYLQETHEDFYYNHYGDYIKYVKDNYSEEYEQYLKEQYGENYLSPAYEKVKLYRNNGAENFISDFTICQYFSRIEKENYDYFIDIIEEDEEDKYNLQFSSNIPGLTQEGKRLYGYTNSMYGHQVKITLTNWDKNYGDLQITKKLIVKGQEQTGDEFKFNVTLTAPEGTELASEYKYMVNDDNNYQTLQLTGDSANTKNATLTIKGGDIVRLIGLPSGTKYEVNEEANLNRYEVNFKNNKESIVGGQITETFFTNTKKKTGLLSVSKSVVGTNNDKDDKFNFTVTLSDESINGDYGEMSFKNGVAKFSLKDSESKTAMDLPEGITYEVTEEENEGYYTTYENNKGTIEDGIEKKAIVTNYKLYLIPDAGGKGIANLIICGTLLIIGSIALIINKYRKEKEV